MERRGELRRGVAAADDEHVLAAVRGAVGHIPAVREVVARAVRLCARDGWDVRLAVEAGRDDDAAGTVHALVRRDGPARLFRQSGGGGDVRRGRRIVGNPPDGLTQPYARLEVVEGGISPQVTAHLVLALEHRELVREAVVVRAAVPRGMQRQLVMPSRPEAPRLATLLEDLEVALAVGLSREPCAYGETREARAHDDHVVRARVERGHVRAFVCACVE
mmetsp:Transcript_43042/g.98673  ORF Transcript_43042/g.98673 Transcript_43042/m.98673 type:complete len:219 (-) Transcript_43042:134-790(-)